jgi:hypothetical protein
MVYDAGRTPGSAAFTSALDAPIVFADKARVPGSPEIAGDWFDCAVRHPCPAAMHANSVAVPNKRLAARKLIVVPPLWRYNRYNAHNRSHSNIGDPAIPSLAKILGRKSRRNLPEMSFPRDRDNRHGRRVRNL